jgi:hypothetical protein
LDQEQAAEILIPMLENLDKVAAKTAKKKKGKEPAVSGTLDTPETSDEAVEQSDIVPAEELTDELADTLDMKGNPVPHPLQSRAKR